MLYGLLGGIFGGFFILFTIMLGRHEIANNLKLLTGKRKGFRKHIMITAGGDIVEKVLKIDRTVDWDKEQKYYYGRGKAYSVNNGGNMWIEGNSQPVNVHLLQKEAEGKKLRDDPKTISVVTRLAYRAGQLQTRGGKELAKEILLEWLPIGLILLAIVLIWKQDESFQLILNAIQSLG